MDWILEEKQKQLDQLNEYRNILFQYPRLRHLFLELTLRCNERCYHCGSRCEGSAQDGLPIEKYLEILQEVKDNFDIHELQLCITGGEPLLYPDFFPLMESARTMGFHWGMTSNGTLITKEVAARLKRAGMGTISISIDGLEETHDNYRGWKGAWKRAMTGVQNLIEEGGFHAIQITSVMNHENIGELDALYEIFQEIDIDSWRVIGLEPIGRALEWPQRMLTKEDQNRLLSFIREKREEQLPVTYGCSHYLGLEWEREVRPWYFLCNSGIYTASIMANGDIGGCLDIERLPELIQGNVWEDSFTNVWRNRFRVFRQRLSSRTEECKSCKSEPYCAGGSFHSWDFSSNRQRICFCKELASVE